MKYWVKVSPRVRRTLDGLRGNVYLRLKSAIDELANNPRPPGCRKMAGRVNEWRIRVGAFRIIYTIDDVARELRIREIGHRRDVYR